MIHFLLDSAYFQVRTFSFREGTSCIYFCTDRSQIRTRCTFAPPTTAFVQKIHRSFVPNFFRKTLMLVGYLHPSFLMEAFEQWEEAWLFGIMYNKPFESIWFNHYILKIHHKDPGIKQSKPPVLRCLMFFVSRLSIWKTHNVTCNATGWVARLGETSHWNWV